MSKTASYAFILLGILCMIFFIISEYYILIDYGYLVLDLFFKIVPLFLLFLIFSVFLFMVRFALWFFNEKKCDSFLEKGDRLRIHGRYKEALRVYDQMIQRNPDYDRSWERKAKVLTKLGRYERAKCCLDRAKNIRTEQEKQIERGARGREGTNYGPNLPIGWRIVRNFGDARSMA